MDLIEEFRETHMEILRGFYIMFESIYRYGKDLVEFCNQAMTGIYVSHSVEVCSLTRCCD
jgi:hypothetical protein